MKRILLLTILMMLASTAYSLPCDKFKRAYPMVEKNHYHNDGPLCVTMNKYAYLFQGKIRLLIPDENGRDNYVDLIDGSKLMLTSGRKYMYMREKKEDHFKKNGFKILEMHTTVRQQHYAGVASTFIKNFVSSMQKIIASDDITKDECEIIRDKVKALYGDNVSDKRTREDADKICREVIEKKERNKADIDKIKDRI